MPITNEVSMRAFPRFLGTPSTQGCSLGVVRTPWVIILPVVLLALQSFGIGCSRKNSVESVSIGDSGIEIRDSEWSLAPGDWSAWRGQANDGVAT
ncbi:MAG: hypothetical protein GY880_12150, partial [Planctomycetaceae bacterium]|nr:hypothetical protein [Planctomycetaceae bacterium]